MQPHDIDARQAPAHSDVSYALLGRDDDDDDGLLRVTKSYMRVKLPLTAWKASHLEVKNDEAKLYISNNEWTASITTHCGGEHGQGMY
jgi:hypothetical protein